jgi:hypothetical protein
MSVWNLKEEEMSRSLGKYSFVLLLATFVSMTPQSGQTQNRSRIGVVRPALGESLTVSALPGAVAFNLAPGASAVGSAPVVITTTWVLTSRTSLNLYASFSSSTAALTDGLGHNIASAQLLGQVTTGLPTTFTAFTQTSPLGPAGADLKLFSQSLGISTQSGVRNDNLNLKIDLTGIGTPAGVYVGTLNIQAQAL